DAKLLDLGVPVLGICYGMQLVAYLSGGEVKPSRQREYGRADVTVREATGLFAGFEPEACITVWASHGDRIEQPPPQFRVTASSLVHRAIGDRLACIFMDHGLLRQGEREQVEHTFRAHLGMDLLVVDAGARFLETLEGVDDPEEKRRRIGHTFIDAFQDAAQ